MESGAVKITRALLGVSDKAGLVEFARALAARGIEIVSTGGTAAALEADGVKVRGVENFTGSPEMLDGSRRSIRRFTAESWRGAPTKIINARCARMGSSRSISWWSTSTRSNARSRAPA
jgi:hypothetical protein